MAGLQRVHHCDLCRAGRVSGRPRDGECLSEAEAGALLFRGRSLPVCVHTSLLLLRIPLVNTQRCFRLTAHTEPYSSKSGLPGPISGSGSSMSKAQSTSLRTPSIFCTMLHPQTERPDSGTKGVWLMHFLLLSPFWLGSWLHFSCL